MPPTERRTAFLIGICGAGMKALAEYLSDQGWLISGSDAAPDIHTLRLLQSRGITVQPGHAARHITPDLTAVISSPAIPPGNCERVAARELGLPDLSSIEVLAELTRRRQTVAIAGTHGKSSTTAMLGSMLQHAGRSPSVLCGAELRDRQRNGWSGTGRSLVVEACEFRRHFLQLAPHTACILSIEADHVDCYPDLHSAQAAYGAFARNATETLVVPDALRILDQAGRPDIRRLTFGVETPQADWSGEHLQPDGQGITFQLHHQGKPIGPVRLQVPGRHNVHNAVASAALGHAQGLSTDEIRAGLEAFTGLKRRFEFLPDRNGAIVIDDYAHHPTEIQAAIATARECFPDRRLICVFQSHQISRTRALLPEFARALSQADQLYVLPIFAARETSQGLEVTLAQELLRSVTCPAGWIPSLDRVWGTVETDAGNDAVILTLGAGNISRVHHELID